jgi:hypothetical protein
MRTIEKAAYAWVFPNENDATNWLEGRTTGGHMVS